MTKIKICGLFRPVDIEYVNLIKPDYCGFVIDFPKSHRSLAPEHARKLRKNLSAEVKPVGVFVDAPVEQVASLLNDGTIAVAQLHGHEDERYIDQLRKLAPHGELWKAFQVSSARELNEAAASSADLILLDSGQGAGRRFDWSLIRDFPRPYLLAGGLTPENIRKAICQLHPYGVDLSSGVETDRVKDFHKIQAAAAAARKE